MIQLIHGDCLDKLKELPDNSVDSIVTDPPYGLSFMGKKWDYDVPSQEIWEECLRVLKPGGYLLSFAGTRTQHRMAVRIEDAGFEIRDMIAWVYGSGFPKSLNIGKVMDKFIKTGNASWNGTGDSSNGALGYSKLQHQQDYRPEDYSNRHQNKSEITEDKAKEWEGWGTALKPALEPITVARKPLGEKTVAQNVLTHGTGGINIDGCRVATTDKYSYPNGAGGNSFSVGDEPDGKRTEPVESNSLGRFPANLIHDGSEEVVGLFPNDSARFFYAPKASKKDRNEGLEGFEDKEYKMNSTPKRQFIDGVQQPVDFTTKPLTNKNPHPTVKPTDLMRYLCRLVTPKGGTVLDPFMGSGSTGKAAKLEGFNFIGIEREKEYMEIAEARINAVPKALF